MLKYRCQSKQTTQWFVYSDANLWRNTDKVTIFVPQNLFRGIFTKITFLLHFYCVDSSPKCPWKCKISDIKINKYEMFDPEKKNPNIEIEKVSSWFSPRKVETPLNELNQCYRALSTLNRHTSNKWNLVFFFVFRSFQHNNYSTCNNNNSNCLSSCGI